MINVEYLYKSEVEYEHRKRFGQFYTPQVIAKFMVSWLLEKKPKKILDPAFGLGAFYFASKELGYDAIFEGYEIDKKSYDFFNLNFCAKNLNIKNNDYFADWSNSYDAIICNPPYLKFQNFSSRDKILTGLGKIYDEKISGYTNIASAFLLKSVYELKQGGRLAYIMPVEFLNTGYGNVIKKILLDNGRIYNILRIEDESSAFPEVITTVCIIFFEKGGYSNLLRFSSINDINLLGDYEKNGITREVKFSEKWLPYFDNKFSIKTNSDLVKLKEYGVFKRGIATGANEFFSLSMEKIKSIGLKDNEYVKCITKSNQIKSSFFTDGDFENLKKKNNNIFLLNIDGENISHAVREYLDYGVKCEYNKRYLTKNRNIWYKLEKRTPAPILFGVFSRGNYKIIRNFTSALNLTCFHGFVPNKNCEEYIDKIFIFLKSNSGNRSIYLNRRIYGKSLNKFEPSDIGEILVPSKKFFNNIDEKFVINEINYLMKYGVVSDYANKIFDSLCKNA